MIIGAYFSNVFNTFILEIVLAFFLIITSIVLYLYSHKSIKPTVKNSIFGGIFSGLIAGLIGTGGAIRGITLASFGLSIETFIATSAFIDLGVDFSRSIVYYTNGFIHKHDLYLILILLLCSV